MKDRSAAIQRRLEDAGLTRKIGSNQVRAIRINVSGTHEDMKRIEEEGRLEEWCADNLKYFADMFGKENIVAAHLHRDEETPHIHVTLVPIVKGKPLEYAGELYSEEHRRKFTTQKAGFQVVKDPTDGTKLVLAIDRKPVADSGVCCSTMMPLADVPDWSPTTSTHGWICIPGWQHCTLKNPTGAETWENGLLISRYSKLFICILLYYFTSEAHS